MEIYNNFIKNQYNYIGVQHSRKIKFNNILSKFNKIHLNNIADPFNPP